MKSLLKWAGIFAFPALVALLMSVAGAPAHALAPLVMHPHLAIVGAGTTALATAFTFLDRIKMMDPNGRIADIIAMSTQKNEILNDIYPLEGNLPTGHRVTVETSLPTGIARMFNQGVPASKGTTAQFDEQCAMFEDRSQVDVKIVDIQNDRAAFRFQKARQHIEGMNQLIAKKLFYGNAGTAPAEFTGFALRFGAISGGATSQNIISAGGAGNTNSSIYLVGWGPDTVATVYPQGSPSLGLFHQDLGEGDAFDASNNRFRALMDLYRWELGLAVLDWRWVVRICNIDIPTLIADGSGATVKLVEYMVKAMDRVPSMSGARLAFYVNRTVASMLRVQALNKSVAQLGVEEAVNQFGERIFELRLLGIPIRLVDQLVETEATVV